MVITLESLKLACLGWDGKEPELDFLYRVYGISVKTTEDGIEIFFRTPPNEHHFIKIRENKLSPIYHCLRLFRTINDVVIGPSTSLYSDSEQEWT